MSDEEQATPHKTRGMNFKLSFSIGWNTEAGGQTETVTKDAHRMEASARLLGCPAYQSDLLLWLNDTACSDAKHGFGLRHLPCRQLRQLRRLIESTKFPWLERNQ